MRLTQREREREIIVFYLINMTLWGDNYVWLPLISCFGFFLSFSSLFRCRYVGYDEVCTLRTK